MCSESLKMLESEEGQSNAVFACFGSAAQQSQYFEVALGEFLSVYNRICKKSLTLQDIKAMEAKLRKQTMGALLTEFKKFVKVNNDKVVNLMDVALQDRNFLMHHFFRERNEKFGTEQGRMEMLRELVSIDNELRTARDITNGMRVALCEALSYKEGTGGTEQQDRKIDSRVLFTMEVDTLHHSTANDTISSVL